MQGANVSMSFNAPVRAPGGTDGVKRMLEVAAALLILLFIAPIFLPVMLLIYCFGGGCVFFGHERIGIGGRRFRVFKFRTMVVDAEARLKHLLETDVEASLSWLRDHKLKNDPRITPVGRFLRKSSIDELPQLLNVIRGEMSFVGPRPIVEAERYKYGRYFEQYCSVRPGITGLWQVSGRNDTSYRRRVAMDVVYCRRSCPMYDLKLLAMTIPAILRWRGSY